MKLFKQAYPARVLEAVMMVVGARDASKRIPDCQRTVMFRGHQYEVCLNSNKDAVQIRWYINHEERLSLQRKVEGWAGALGPLEVRAAVSPQKGDDNYDTAIADVRLAQSKLAQIRKDLEQAQAMLNKDTPIIFEQRKISDIAGQYLVIESVYAEEKVISNGHIRVSEPANEGSQGSGTADLAEPGNPRGKGGRPKGSKNKKPRKVAAAR